MKQEKPSEQRRQSLGRVVGSVFASMFGVQSRKKHQDDFERGNPTLYIVVGLIATALFVVAVWAVVRLVIAAAAA